MILRAAQRETALERGRRPSVNDLGDLGRADEAHRRDSRVIADRFHRFLPAVDDLKYTFRQPGFPQQLGYLPRTERHQLGRLENDAIAERDRIWNRPVRDHVRKIERRDGGNDAEGIALDSAFNSPADLPHLAG